MEHSLPFVFCLRDKAPRLVIFFIYLTANTAQLLLEDFREHCVFLAPSYPVGPCCSLVSLCGAMEEGGVDIKCSCSFCALEQWVRVTKEPRHIASLLHFHSAAHALSQSLNKTS